MPPSGTFALTKAERITGRTMVDALFRGGQSRSVPYYPLRAVYRMMPYSGAAVRVLFSVPKRYMHHAIDRNHVKRQMREAYRLNKHILYDVMAAHENETLTVAFIWQGQKSESSEGMAKRMVNILTRISDKI